MQIQPNFNGSNTFGTMKICLSQGQFEIMSVNHSGRSGHITEAFFYIFRNMKVYCVLSLEMPH